uniref:pilus assembly protein n=1 Tax=Castellaniella defragrans TaxID=75697 RepID=UPI0033424394
MRATPASPHTTTRQHGVGMAEFLLAALPILLLGAGGIETAHWLLLRQSLSFALVEAGRAAATRQADPAALAQAFEDALHILHPQAGQRDAALAWRRRALNGLPWQIRIVRPARASFLDHAAPDLDSPAGGTAQGLTLIRNDRQHEQYLRGLGLGWPDGRGPASGETIFEANTLVLELTWPHRPLLPGIAALLRLMAGPATPADYRQRVLAQGLLPIMRSAALAMHSHPANWPDLADGRVVHDGPTSIRRSNPAD